MNHKQLRSQKDACGNSHGGTDADPDSCTRPGTGKAGKGLALVAAAGSSDSGRSDWDSPRAGAGTGGQEHF